MISNKLEENNNNLQVAWMQYLDWYLPKTDDCQLIAIN